LLRIHPPSFKLHVQILVMKIKFSCAGVIIVFLFSFLMSLNLSAQWYDPEKVNKKAKLVYESAYDFAMQGDYESALIKIESAIKLEPKYVEAFLSRASVYAELKNYKLSVQDFKTAFQLDSIFCEHYQLPYSISLAGIGDFENALKQINGFLLLTDLNEQSKKSGMYRKRTYQFAIDHDQAYPKDNTIFNPLNLGDSINSEYLEYYPSFTIDGKKLIITRRINQDEDFFESNKIGDNWSKAKPVEGKINTNLNEGAQQISQDGQWLVFTGCNYPEGLGSCDLYISYLKKNGTWSEAENLGPLVNSEQWESAPSLSPDKKTLYFASNRTGGYGGKDIWKCERKPNGKWSEPVNLGDTINTPADETCPFIHADNQTLYFNSNGHPGYGLTDLFLTRKNDEEKWMKPINLGFPINTIDDEGSLVVAADGQSAYYASDRKEKKSGLDIYQFKLPNFAQSVKTSWVTGTVIDEKTKQGLPSELIMTEMGTRRRKISVQTNEDGEFVLPLPIQGDYLINVIRKGYLFYSKSWKNDANSTMDSVRWNISLTPIEKGSGLILRNISFEKNAYIIGLDSYAELEQLAQLLKDNTTIKIEITGHTDNEGTKADNLILSQKRAKAVVTYLIEKGIAAERLSFKGYGDTKPIATNDTEQGKSLNRRTEINVVSLQ
jgi:outer membrane protein OmpA-like peptidoglycan-associated protein/tetratricopeptide (TPR) repeat protein